MNIERYFFTGVPGSRWSGIAQLIEDNVAGFNRSDRSEEKEYQHHSFTGHKGAYFGKGMEFEARLDNLAYLDAPWLEPGGKRLLKSHDWAYMLDDIKTAYPEDKIFLVYRPDMVSFGWWHEAGGFQIKYPDYSSYKDSQTMLAAIMEQNKLILKFGCKHKVTWHHFGPEFVKQNFDTDIVLTDNRYEDCLVSII